MNQQPQKIESREMNLLAAAVDISAANPGANSSTSTLRRFSMIAYTGQPMVLAGWRYPVVVDLDGMNLGARQRPILLDHTRDVDFVMGQTDRIEVREGKLLVEGQVMGESGKARQAIALADKGFAWQASIGARAEQTEFVPEGKTAVANGRQFTGPLNIVRRSSLGEVSLVALGADEDTSAHIAATAAEDSNMETAENATTTPTTPAPTAQAAPAAMKNVDPAKELRAQAAPAATENVDPAKELRAQAAAESRRIAAVRRICAGRHPEIEAQAIAEGWDESKTELAVLRAERPRVGVLTSRGQVADAAVLEAALRLGGQESEAVLVAQYGAATMERAHPLRRIGLRKLIDACCQMEGREPPGIGASESEVIRAAFSTISLPGILSNVANKTMLAAYTAVPGVARLLARKLSVSDFKQNTGYRLTGDMTMQEVGPDGELKHATLGESSFTYQARTYGRMFGLTRRDLINDDLGAFMEVPRLIGRGAALTLEEAFWALVLANTGNFFSTGNKNYISGATTVLGPDGLEQAVQKFLEQTDADGKPIVLNPRWLVVPPPLKVTADQLYKSTVFNTGGAATATKVPNANVFAGLYEPVVSPYLSNAAFAGSSATAWYLWGDPADVAAFGICYLNGNETPTIEDAPPAPNILGQGWRGYFDFGVCQIDPRGVVKSKGAA